MAKVEIRLFLELEHVFLYLIALRLIVKCIHKKHHVYHALQKLNELKKSKRKRKLLDIRQKCYSSSCKYHRSSVFSDDC